MFTRDELFICFEGEDIVRDLIPLSEVISVQPMGTSESWPIPSSFKQPSLSGSKSMRTSRFGSSAKDCKVPAIANSIVISTTTEGYNSGRKYYFKLKSDESSDVLLKQLQKSAKEARKIKEGKTRFQNSQISLSRFMNSSPFQALTALLVLMVITPSANCLKPTP